MKRAAGFLLLGLFALTILIGVGMMIHSALEIYSSETNFITGFGLSFGGVLIADEVLPLFFEEWEDEDEDK